MTTVYDFNSDMLGSSALWCLNNPGRELLLTTAQMRSVGLPGEIAAWAVKAGLELRECADGWRFKFQPVEK